MIDCIGERWTLGYSDPSLLGGALALMYFLASGFAAMRARDAVATPNSDIRLITFWSGLTLFLFALAINKPLDFHSLLTASMRCVSQEQGWYGARRTYQAWFVIGVGSLAGFLAMISLYWLRRHMGVIQLALAGAVLLLLFVAASVASFHHLDTALSAEFSGIKVRRVIEIVALSLTIVGSAGAKPADRA